MTSLIVRGGIDLVKDVKKSTVALMIRILRDYALALLSKRELSVYILREKLMAKAKKSRLEIDQVEALLEEFKQKDWVSDQRFCESFVRDQISKQNGPRKIHFNSLKYGLNKALVESTIEKLYRVELQVEKLLELKVKREKRKVKGSDFEAKMQLKQYLVGRGFEYEIIEPYL